MKGNRKTLSLFLGILSALACTSFAWACTGQTRILSIMPQAGSVGTAVTVTGNGIAPGTPVQVRWNSVTQAELASTRADDKGAFSVGITVPDAGPGVHYLVIASGTEGVGRSAFQVTAPVRTSSSDIAVGNSKDLGSPTDLWAGFDADTRSALSSGIQGNQELPSKENALLGIFLLSAGAAGAVTAIGLSERRRRRPRGLGRRTA